MTLRDSTTSLKKDVQVFITEDRMNAYVTLASPPLDQTYTVQEVINALQLNRVVSGIDQATVKALVEKESYNIRTLVACGIPCVNGENGFFEFFFRREISHGPKMLPDGSIDYRSMELAEMVNAGDRLVQYHPAVEGISGSNVLGNILNPYRGKDLPPLKGSGFTMTPDYLVYTALVSGKVELLNNNLFVTNLLLIEGDTDNSTGDIRFNGDVVIKGSVNYGYSIYADGNVTVCGCVEAAKIVAGGNVILQNGMQGGGKGYIECTGNVSGKFFEQVHIVCGGSLSANSIMHCNIKAEEQVILAGRHGIIVGGVTEAVGGINATVLGNIAEVKTKITVGSTFSVKDLSTAIEEINNLTEMLSKIDFGLSKLEEMITVTNSVSLKQKQMDLMQARESKQTQLEEQKSLLSQLQNSIELSKQAVVRVSKYFYPGVTVTINGISYKNEDTFNGVTIKLVNNEIKIFANRPL